MKKTFCLLVLCLVVLFSACSSTGSSSSFDETPVSSTSDLSSSFTESASFPESSSSEVESPSYPYENSDRSSTNKVGDLVYTVDSVWYFMSDESTETEAAYFGGNYNTQLRIFTETELNGTPVKDMDTEEALQLAGDLYFDHKDSEIFELSRERTEYVGCPALVLKIEYPDQPMTTAGELRQTSLYSMTVILLRGDTLYTFRLGTPDEPKPDYEEDLLATLDSAYFEE